jgi:hypothetical protein
MDAAGPGPLCMTAPNKSQPSAVHGRSRRRCRRREGRYCAERWWAPGAGVEKGERKDTEFGGGRTKSGEYCLVNVVYKLLINVMCCQGHSKESFVWRQQHQVSACALQHNTPSTCTVTQIRRISFLYSSFVFVITTHAPAHFDKFALPHRVLDL